MAPRDLVHMTKLGGKGAGSRHLIVPSRLAQFVPDETVFRPELTREGILYRVVSAPALELPEWLKDGRQSQ